ncbi:TonB-dependent siderophore receptor [Massilia dura]|uniref:TonB-dependent siderophore receptor n=1 Tax=Pseudoduganella dura TaxID=321982 RepID=A0A6I3XT58_9BURK|nr:TonB-dependent siderophore receptor [Pseudoduganella dura]MUI14955.1 TonB-dependent siderophore receptor [Pseudoduganella dura]GGY01304.1 TonB-dependent receptor [Pseudoduganella dura]
MNIATFTPAPARRRLSVLSLHCLLAIAALPGTAHAQDGTLPTVVVTARADNGGLGTEAATGSNLGLSRFDTPASIDVITRRQLEERGDIDLLDAITRAPGISAMPHPGNGNSSVAARGFTDTTSVMRLYDGMRQYGGAGLTFPFDTWSIERIEVLRGPASVIHGDGAIGGVINVIPKQPARNAPEHELQLGIGNEHSRRAAFGSGGAIDERWSYRFDASTERADGWVDRGEHSSRSISAAIRLDVSPDLNFRFSTARGEQEPMRYFGTPLVDGRPVAALAEKNYNVADSAMRFDDRWTDVLVNWKPNVNTTVRSRFYSIGSDRHWRNVEGYYYNAATGLLDRADATEIFHDQSQTGNTTDMAVKGTLFGLANAVSAGFDINSSSFTHINNTYVGSAPSVDLFDPVPGNFSSSMPTIPRYHSDAKQYALFAEDRLQLTEKWSVLAGLRYDHAELARDDLVAGRQAYERTFTNVGWRLGTVVQATPSLALYGQYAKAADPIGALLFLSTANSRFDSASGRQLEIGVKHASANGAEWTLAVYDITKNNLLTRDPANPSQSVQVGERSSRGIEATVTAALAPGWRIEANASLLRAQFEDFNESSGGKAVSRAGNTPPDVPRRLANVWLNWDFVTAWTASAGLRYVGERYADNANTLKMPGYAVTDLSLRWQAAPRTGVTLRAANVFDKRYFTTAYYMPQQWFYGPDRKVDLIVNHRF